MALTRSLVGALTCSLVSAVPKWAPSHPVDARRLGLELSQSTNDVSDSTCIVAGYDEAAPAHIYIGGPCSGLTGSGDNLSVGADFRWLEMATVHAAIVPGNGEDAVKMRDVENTAFSRGISKNGYDSISTGKQMLLDYAGFENAGFFMSVASYLSKATFTYNKNDFTIEKKESWDEVNGVCVVACCDASTAKPCECSSGCPTDERTANAGDYKFSILAASFDETGGSTQYVNGSSGNGWEKVVSDHGVGDPKVLEASLKVYQTIDFTNMKADTLEISNSTNTVLYKDMVDCDLFGDTDCTTYPVSTMKLKSDNWQGMYEFIETFNVGGWTGTESGKTAEVSTTRSVEITCVKPDAKTLNTIGYQGKKVVLVKYSFDISGITATAWETGKSGKYMVYDPTVTTIPNTVSSTSYETSVKASNTANGAYDPIVTTIPNTVSSTSYETSVKANNTANGAASGAMRVGVNFIFLSCVLCLAGLSFS